MDLIGRERELAILRGAIDRAPGVLPNVVLHGDPGVGKSVLLGAALEYARERGVRVLGGSGFESEAQLAFAGLHQLFAPVMDHLDRVEPFHQDVLRRVLGLKDEAGPRPAGDLGGVAGRAGGGGEGRAGAGRRGGRPLDRPSDA